MPSDAKTFAGFVTRVITVFDQAFISSRRIPFSDACFFLLHRQERVDIIGERSMNESCVNTECVRRFVSLMRFVE